MLLFEQVRRVRNEENLVEDTNLYSETGTTDYVTKTSKQITLTETKNILVKFTLKFTYSGQGTGKAAGRVLLNNVPFMTTGLKTKSYNTTGTYSVQWQFDKIVKLPAGTYTLDFQISVIINSVKWEIGEVYIGIIDFADLNIYTSDSGDVTATDAATTTVDTISFTVPSDRALPVGSLNQVPVIVLVSCGCEGYAGSKLKNTGEADEAVLNWKLYLDAAQVDWSERTDDYQTDEPTYAEGAYGKYIRLDLTKGQQYTLRLDVYNNSGLDRTVRSYISIIICPWLILFSGEYEPFTLDFPQGSTLYVTLEPLSRNPTKNVKLGKKRAVSFGDSTDYYSTASGTDILTYNYTFETIEISNCILTLEGYGACVSVIGVDVR